MNKVQDGIWHWTAPHPDWEEGANWDQIVSSYAIEDGKRLYLIDPLAPPDEMLALIADHGGETTLIILTCPWHRRDTAGLVARFDAHVYVPHPDPADRDPVHGSVYTSGDTLPGGVVAFPGLESNDLVLWFPNFGAVTAGDTLLARDGQLLIPEDWIDSSKNSLQNVKHELKPLLELPVDLVLPTHGDPFTGEALRLALA